MKCSARHGCKLFVAHFLLLLRGGRQSQELLTYLSGKLYFITKDWRVTFSFEKARVSNLDGASKKPGCLISVPTSPQPCHPSSLGVAVSFFVLCFFSRFHLCLLHPNLSPLFCVFFSSLPWISWLCGAMTTLSMTTSAWPSVLKFERLKVCQWTMSPISFRNAYWWILRLQNIEMSGQVARSISVARERVW